MAKITVLDRRLGRHRANGDRVVGLAYIDEKLALIDPRQAPRQYLSTLIHELLHLAYPELLEHQVRKGERILIKHLWEMNYRRISQ